MLTGTISCIALGISAGEGWGKIKLDCTKAEMHFHQDAVVVGDFFTLDNEDRVKFQVDTDGCVKNIEITEQLAHWPGDGICAPDALFWRSTSVG